LFVVNLQEVRKGLSDLRDGLKKIKQDLEEHFAGADENVKYGKQMWNFVRKATIKLEDLVDNVNLADGKFAEVIRYYGEEDKNMSSSEFFAIFKTFVTSYKVWKFQAPSGANCLTNPQKCKGDNLAAAEDRLAREKRKQASEQNKAARLKASEASTALENDDASVLDNLLEKLRNGDNVSRRARRARPTADGQSDVPLTLVTDGSLSGVGNNAADIARDMLARLKSDGFEAFKPSTPSPSPAPRPRRRRGTGAGNPPVLNGSNDWMLAVSSSESSTSVESASSATTEVAS
jgi:cytokinesis protein